MRIELAATLPATISLLTTEITFENQSVIASLWDEQLNPLMAQMRQSDTLETIKDNPAIVATKAAYRQLGKDPSRFRPASDSLWRRVVKGQGLYQVNGLVDLNNYLSLRHHLPFGSYDLDTLQGDLRLTTGAAGETYPGIGKRAINLEHLLVLADDAGPFGSPTSDSTRAMITEETQRALVVGYGFDVSAHVQTQVQHQVAELAQRYLPHCVVTAQTIIQ